MSGKLDRAIAESETGSRSRELAAEMYVRERRALDEQIPTVWAKLRAAIRVKCEAKPKHLLFTVCPDTEAKVERLGGPDHATLELRLLRDSGVVEFYSEGRNGYFTIRLNRQNIAGVCDQNGHPFTFVEDAAEEVLSLLFS